MRNGRDGQGWGVVHVHVHVHGKEGAGILQGIKEDYLYAHTEGTKELDLVLRDELSKCDENGSLECRLTVVVHVISGWK